jgi:hypothetical protein
MGIQAINSSTTVNNLNALTQSRSLNASTASDQTSQSSSTQKAGGTRLTGGSSSAKTTASSTSSSSSLIYDKRDLNQDGIVTALEELLYDLKNPLAEDINQPDLSSSQLQNGLNAYKQGLQPDQSLTKSPLSIT